MTLKISVREQVRLRANFACEYCGVREIDVGGELTIDHYHPVSQGGTDDLENLVYCCHRCNSYKADYWPSDAAAHLWNPRQELWAQHFLLLSDGSLHPRTPIGTLTIRRLQLNRAPLVAYRLERQCQSEVGLLLEQYRANAEFWEHIAQQRKQALARQDELLEKHLRLLDSVFDDD